jgi:hypothetical protein
LSVVVSVECRELPKALTGRPGTRADQQALSGESFVPLACELAGRSYGLQVAPRWTLRLMGLFNTILRENDEMMYQFDDDYRFDSSKIERAFGAAWLS